MAGFLDSRVVGIPCSCGRKTEKSIGWIKTNKEFTCACGKRIALDADQFVREIAKAEGGLAKFKQSLKRLGK